MSPRSSDMEVAAMNDDLPWLKSEGFEPIGYWSMEAKKFAGWRSNSGLQTSRNSLKCNKRILNRFAVFLNDFNANVGLLISGS